MGVPPNRWFMENPIYKWMMTGDFPILGNLQISNTLPGNPSFMGTTLSGGGTKGQIAIGAGEATKEPARKTPKLKVTPKSGEYGG